MRVGQAWAWTEVLGSDELQLDRWLVGPYRKRLVLHLLLDKSGQVVLAALLSRRLWIDVELGHWHFLEDVLFVLNWEELIRRLRGTAAELVVEVLLVVLVQLVRIVCSLVVALDVVVVGVLKVPHEALSRTAGGEVLRLELGLCLLLLAFDVIKGLVLLDFIKLLQSSHFLSDLRLTILLDLVIYTHLWNNGCSFLWIIIRDSNGSTLDVGELARVPHEVSWLVNDGDKGHNQLQQLSSQDEDRESRQGLVLPFPGSINIIGGGHVFDGVFGLGNDHD